MNEETDQLTTNIEADPPGYRPAKRKKTAKKAAPGKQKSKSGSVTAAKSKPASGKKPAAKKAGPSSKKVGKSSKPAKKTGAPAKRSKTLSSGSKRPGKSRSGATSSRRTSSPKKLGKVKASGSKGLQKGSGRTSALTGKNSSPNESAGTKRTYTKHQPEGVDIAALKPAKDYGISRIEQETKKNFGYYVRVGPPGGRSSVFFSDKKHGSPAKALKAAVEKRNELFEALPDWYKVRASRKRGVKVGPAKKKAA